MILATRNSKWLQQPDLGGFIMQKKSNKSTLTKFSLLALSSMLAFGLATSGAFARDGHQGGAYRNDCQKFQDRGQYHQNYDNGWHQGGKWQHHEKKHHRVTNNYYNKPNCYLRNCRQANHHHPGKALLGFQFNFGF